jgi:hypothetical protein
MFGRHVCVPSGQSFVDVRPLQSMKPAKPKQRRTHRPEDIAEIMATFGCTERHARRILSEGGKEYALEMRELQAEKMRLQIRRIEIWLKDSAEKYIHVDEYARQKKAVVEIVREAMDKLAARLLRELPGRTAAEMARLIEEAGDDARREMARMADESLKREGIE